MTVEEILKFEEDTHRLVRILKALKKLRKSSSFLDVVAMIIKEGEELNDIQYLERLFNIIGDVKIQVPVKIVEKPVEKLAEIPKDTLKPEDEMWELLCK